MKLLRYALILSLLGAACTPEDCEKWPDACPFNDCGPCPCPVGTQCVENNACASLCSLMVLHDPPGNSCGHLSPDAVCVEESPELTRQELGVCRAPTGVPMCLAPGDT